MAKKETPATPPPVEEKAPVEQVTPPPAPVDPVKTVTAASIVGEDTDKFPAGGPSSPPPIAAPESAGGAPSAESPKRGRGRPPGSKNKNPSFDDLPPPPPPKAQVDHKALAAVMFTLGTSTLANVLGPEWLPRPPQPGLPGEEEMVVMAAAKYMESKDMSDIPPGVMLCLVLTMYSAPRFRAPSTKEKVFGVWMWIKSKFTKKKKNFVTSETTREPEKPDPRVKDNIAEKDKVPTVGERPEDWDKV